ncbi:MAG: hypothetical protein AB7H96_12125 [Vicinamibacterales bacterium]
MPAPIMEPVESAAVPSQVPLRVADVRGLVVEEVPLHAATVNAARTPIAAKKRMT